MTEGGVLRRLYLTASTVFPPALVARAERLLEEGGIPRNAARTYLGFSLFASLGLGLTAFFLSPFFALAPLEFHALVGLVVFLLALALLYSYLIMRADGRAEEIETLLPDALQIISSNIRAGMTLENAFWSAARPEFGPLRDEIKKVSAQTIGGRPFRAALLEVRERVRSQLLERAIRLIVEGIALGGEMARLLEEVSKDMRNTQLLRREIATQTMMYTLFIVFASVLVSPLLFSVALYYSEVSERISARTEQAQQELAGTAAGARVPISGFRKTASPDRITSADIRLFALASITATNLFSALIIGGIRTGKRARGLKYIVAFILASLAIFLLAHGFLSTTLGAFQ